MIFTNAIKRGKEHTVAAYFASFFRDFSQRMSDNYYQSEYPTSEYTYSEYSSSSNNEYQQTTTEVNRKSFAPVWNLLFSGKNLDNNTFAHLFSFPWPVSLLLLLLFDYQLRGRIRDSSSELPWTRQVITKVIWQNGENADGYTCIGLVGGYGAPDRRESDDDDQLLEQEDDNQLFLKVKPSMVRPPEDYKLSTCKDTMIIKGRKLCKEV